MELTYTSVTKFFSDLKAHLLSNGMTVVRTVVPETDVVLDTGSGFFRFQRAVVSPSVMAIGWAFGDDADVLAVAELNSERIFPFATTPDAEFTPTFHWNADERWMGFTVMSSNDYETRGSRYRAEVRFGSKQSRVQHDDRFRPQYEPNFKDKGGSYIPAGA